MSDQEHTIWVKLDNDVKEITVSQDDSIKKVIVKAVGQSKTPKSARLDGRTFKRTQVVKDLPITTKENPMEIFKGKNIFQHGLPPAALFGGTTFSSSTKSKPSHQPAQFDTKTFEFIILDAVREKKSSTFESVIWMIHNEEAEYGWGSLVWGSEAQVYSLVERVLRNVSLEIGMSQMNSIQQLSLFEAFKPDIWIVCAFGIPIGLVEVTSSLASNPPLENPMSFGQIYDYLTYLKECLGVVDPFGILTTYDEWQIVWLPESDDYATASQLPPSYGQPPASTNYPSCVQGPQYHLMDLDPPNWDKNPALHIPSAGRDITEGMADFSLANPQPARSDDSQDRVLHGTNIISWNDPELSFIIASVLHKMNASPRNSIEMSLQLSRSYIFVSKDTWQWEKPKQSVSLHVKSTIPSEVDHAFLLADLGGGGDGRVWLGSTASGEVFVAKFSEDESSLQQEKQLWESIWNCSTRVTQLNNYSVLLMPWIKPCHTKQELNDEVKLAAKQAIKAFAIAGYRHDDLKWSHVGLYIKDNKLQALLFDLARVTKIKPSELTDAEESPNDKGRQNARFLENVLGKEDPGMDDIPSVKKH